MRPKIDQIRMVYMTDPNTALANLLAGAANVATDTSIDLQQAVVLDQEWVARGAGTVLKSTMTRAGEELVIKFDEHGVKIFAVSDATLWPLSG